VKQKQLTATHGARKFVLAFDPGDDVLPLLQRFLERDGVSSATLCAIGGFERAALAFFDLQAKRYEPIEIGEQVEVVSCLGNVAMYEDKPKIHMHCIVSYRDGRPAAGHLLAGIVRPTLEMFVDELPHVLHRTDRPAIGLPLLDL
jgi:predicted DNA-binding protein with PD1-like motif